MDYQHKALGRLSGKVRPGALLLADAWHPDAVGAVSLMCQVAKLVSPTGSLYELSCEDKPAATLERNKQLSAANS